MKKNDYIRLAFIFYVLLLGYASLHHELWGDEVHSWNIAKGSGSYLDLIANRRYEGHPPAWHTILWLISKCTHQVFYMQVAQWLIACSVVFLVLFRSPFALSTRLLIPFGYYFLFEYGILSRNYGLGVFFACWICLIMRKEFRYRTVLYYALLFCLSNVHLLAMLLAGSLHFYFLLLEAERKKSVKTILAHILGGILVFLPAIYFIIPPPDAELSAPGLLHMWNIHQLMTFYEVPLRALLPLPAWWNQHFWNTQFLIEARNDYGLPAWINPLVTALLLSLVFFILRRSRKASLLFFVNLLLNLVVSVTFYGLNTARYTGFVYIGFIAAYWLFCGETHAAGRRTRVAGRRTPVAGWHAPATAWYGYRLGSLYWANLLLALQLPGGLFALYKDIRLPFSNTYQVGQLIKEVPTGQKWVTDYWTMNAVVAFTDHPAYCVDMQREMSFVLWGPDITALQKTSNRYCTGLQQFFKKEGVQSVYMITQATLPMLQKTDPLLAANYYVVLLDKREGAIEKGSNLYLYRISGH